MKAWRLPYSKADRLDLDEVPTPEPAAGEVLDRCPGDRPQQLRDAAHPGRLGRPWRRPAVPADPRHRSRRGDRGGRGRRTGRPNRRTGHRPLPVVLRPLLGMRQRQRKHLFGGRVPHRAEVRPDHRWRVRRIRPGPRGFRHTDPGRGVVCGRRGHDRLRRHRLAHGDGARSGPRERDRPGHRRVERRRNDARPARPARGLPGRGDGGRPEKANRLHELGVDLVLDHRAPTIGPSRSTGSPTAPASTASWTSPAPAPGPAFSRRCVSADEWSSVATCRARRRVSISKNRRFEKSRSWAPQAGRATRCATC